MPASRCSSTRAASPRPTFPPGVPDPLSFTDLRDHPDRLREAARRSGKSEAVLCAAGEIGGPPVVLAVMDFGFLGGSMGTAVGEKITGPPSTRCGRTRSSTICASGGARMQEGVVVAAADGEDGGRRFARLREAGVLSLSVLTDPVYGGVAASFAALGDVIIAEPGARARVRRARGDRADHPADAARRFQTAEFLLEHGHIDLVVRREELRPVLPGSSASPRLRPTGLRRGRPTQPAGPPEDRRSPGNRTVGTWSGGARDRGRPTAWTTSSTASTASWSCTATGPTEDDPAIVGGLAGLGGPPVVVVGHAKGHTANELVARNFGMPHPSGYRKALRLMRPRRASRACRWSRSWTPPGAYPGSGRGARPGGRDRRESAQLAGCRCRSSAVVTGEGGSGGALALAVGDRVLMLEHASLLGDQPRGLRRDPVARRRPRPRRRGAAADRGPTCRLGVVDEVVPEPEGGAHPTRRRRGGPVRAAVLRSDLAERPGGRTGGGRYRRLPRSGLRRLAVARWHPGGRG